MYTGRGHTACSPPSREGSSSGRPRGSGTITWLQCNRVDSSKPESLAVATPPEERRSAVDDRIAVCPRAPRLAASDPVQVRPFAALAWHPMEPLASTAGRPPGTPRDVNASYHGTSP